MDLNSEKNYLLLKCWIRLYYLWELVLSWKRWDVHMTKRECELWSNSLSTGELWGKRCRAYYICRKCQSPPSIILLKFLSYYYQLNNSEFGDSTVENYSWVTADICLPCDWLYIILIIYLKFETTFWISKVFTPYSQHWVCLLGVSCVSILR